MESIWIEKKIEDCVGYEFLRIIWWLKVKYFSWEEGYVYDLAVIVK